MLTYHRVFEILRFTAEETEELLRTMGVQTRITVEDDVPNAPENALGVNVVLKDSKVQFPVVFWDGVAELEEEPFTNRAREIFGQIVEVAVEAAHYDQNTLKGILTADFN